MYLMYAYSWVYCKCLQSTVVKVNKPLIYLKNAITLGIYFLVFCCLMCLIVYCITLLCFFSPFTFLVSVCVIDHKLYYRLCTWVGSGGVCSCSHPIVSLQVFFPPLLRYYITLAFPGISFPCSPVISSFLSSSLLTIHKCIIGYW